nr:DNA helicase [Tanacetum cinerariifolium]
MSSQTKVSGDTPSYIDLANFVKEAEYHLCCGGGKIYMPPMPNPPAFIQKLLNNTHFIEHIRAYNQMFEMTSFGEKIDDSLYVYDTRDEVSNIMQHFGGLDESTLNPETVEGLIHVLDEHNGLVRLFRTARDRYNAGKIPAFKIRLYNMGGVRGRTSSNINKLHQSYMSLQFPLLFVFGEPGFYLDLTLKPRSGKGRGKKVTMNAYYKYQLHPRVKEFGFIFRSGRLFQQYVVTVFCAIEMNHLDYIRNHQNDHRSDYLSGLYDVVSRGDREGIVAGSKIMLPNTITGGPRLFELSEGLLYTIEFQKRGLPHCHALLWMDFKSELQDAERIDEFISAEIPNPVEDPQGYKLVTDLMMNGPYGNANLSASCTQGATCNKHFPKKYNANTFFDSSGHTQYRRRDTGIFVMNGESRLDNCNVVPYNRALCLDFEAYINVDYCGWIMLIKYQFKYISKGPDRILVKISNSKATASVPGNNKQINEIQNYVDGRFICRTKPAGESLIFQYIVENQLYKFLVFT